FSVGDCRQKSDLGAPRIESRVLDDDWHVRLEYRGIVGITRDRFRVVEIIEAQVQCAPGGDSDAIGTDRLAVGEENRNGDVSVMIGGVEDACSFVGNQLAVGISAFRGNIALGDRPSPASN